MSIISKLNKNNVPMQETHYYQWLKDLKLVDIHAINTKKSYLLCLDIGEITEKEFEILKAIESHYFYWEVVKKGVLQNEKI